MCKGVIAAAYADDDNDDTENEPTGQPHDLQKATVHHRFNEQVQNEAAEQLDQYRQAC